MKHLNKLRFAVALCLVYILQGCNQPPPPGNKPAPLPVDTTCYDKTGETQSPIDIIDGKAQEFTPVDLYTITVNPVTMKVWANTEVPHHYNIYVSPAGSPADLPNCVMFQGERYDFNSLHFHDTSEHKINSQASSMEMHIVYQKGTTNQRIVFGILINALPNSMNNDIAALWEQFKKVTNPADTGALRVDLRSYLGFLGGGYYSYPGSLTTEPYKEGVLWFVVKRQMTIDTSQYTMFKSFKINNERIGITRKAQPTGNRIVLKTK